MMMEEMMRLAQEEHSEFPFLLDLREEK